MAHQESLFGPDNSRVVTNVPNVASVPQRSPFRYPGGKTWLVPTIRQWLGAIQPEVLIEPFVGGGIVSLTAVMENLVGRAIIIEKDEGVAAVWKTILDGNAEWLANRIVQFELTASNVQKELERDVTEVREVAFTTILRNRCFHGGILADGAGLMKQGENGKGISSRWYPGTLRKRILAIAHYRDRIQFIEGDGFSHIAANKAGTNIAFFIDPPYTKAGKRLYRYSQVDHSQLFGLTSSVAGDFLMTYDNAEEIHVLANQYQFETRAIAMKNTHNARQTELLIGPTLSWLND